MATTARAHGGRQRWSSVTVGPGSGARTVTSRRWSEISAWWAELEGRIWQREPASDGGELKLTSVLGTMLAIPQRVNNQFLHHNPSGLVSFVDNADGEFVFEDGPSEDWVPQAHYFLYACYSLLVVLLIRTY